MLDFSMFVSLTNPMSFNDPNLSEQTVEEKIEERALYKPYFEKQSELELFLRLPLHSHETRLLFLKQYQLAHLAQLEQQKKDVATETKTDESNVESGNSHTDTDSKNAQ
jgi:hypothetical protein